MTIRIKRAYAPPEKSDGVRVLVDHLWPRGLKKEALQVERWIQAVSPSNALRAWFGHEPARWKEFQRRYRGELDARPQTWKPLLEMARDHDITLVFSARDVAHNNAVVLKAYLERKLGRPARDQHADGPADEPPVARARRRIVRGHSHRATHPA